MSLTAQTLAIRNVTLIDGTGAALQTRATVIVDGDRISAVGGSRLSIPDDAETIDGSGKFLTPGLMDVHVHVPGRIVRNGKGEWFALKTEAQVSAPCTAFSIAAL